MLDLLRDAAGVAADDGKTGGHRLGDRQSERLEQRRLHVDVRKRIDERQLRRRHRPGEDDLPPVRSSEPLQVLRVVRAPLGVTGKLAPLARRQRAAKARELTADEQLRVRHPLEQGGQRLDEHVQPLLRRDPAEEEHDGSGAEPEPAPQRFHLGAALGTRLLRRRKRRCVDAVAQHPDLVRLVGEPLAYLPRDLLGGAEHPV